MKLDYFLYRMAGISLRIIGIYYYGYPPFSSLFFTTVRQSNLVISGLVS